MTQPAEAKKQLIDTKNATYHKVSSAASEPLVGEKIALQDQALLEWSNLNYFIPSKPQKATI